MEDKIYLIKNLDSIYCKIKSKRNIKSKPKKSKLKEKNQNKSLKREKIIITIRIKKIIINNFKAIPMEKL